MKCNPISFAWGTFCYVDVRPKTKPIYRQIRLWLTHCYNREPECSEGWRSAAYCTGIAVREILSLPLANTSNAFRKQKQYRHKYERHNGRLEDKEIAAACAKWQVREIIIIFWSASCVQLPRPCAAALSVWIHPRIGRGMPLTKT